MAERTFLLFCFAFTGSAFADVSVVFNEIMYHPATNEPAMEWLELYNQMAVDVDMSGWMLDGDIQYTFAPNTVLHGGGFMVVAISPSTLSAATGLTNVLGPFTNRLSNGGGKLKLRNNNGRVVNEVDYDASGDWPVAPDGSGVSLAKLDHSTDSATPGNWAPSAQMGGTPGRENFPTTPAIVTVALNEVSASTNASFWLELMNYGTNSLSIGNFKIIRDGATNGQYVFSPGTTLPARSFLAVSNSTLGFKPLQEDKLYLEPPGATNVIDAIALKDRPKARWPDGTGAWLNPTTPSPAASNSFLFHRELVINEIMFHHQLLPAAGTNSLPVSSTEEWIELYNRTNTVVDLTGWQIEGGISFSFPAGKTINPGAYLVVAKNSAALRTNYPTIDIIGDFSGKLSHDGDSLVLDDAAGNPVNSVHYYTSERWGETADGGGSSLELRDPSADNAKAEAWATSDESTKSSWQTNSYQMVAQTIVGPELWNDFVMGLLDRGECLVDDISVVESPSSNPTQFIANGNFESSTTGWRFLGNHSRSRVESEPGNPSNHVLHLVATGPQEDVHNHIETTFVGTNSVSNGQVYQISYRVKWLNGNNLLNTRLYYDRVAKTTTLTTPQLNGTPGARNSRYATNIGPTFAQFQHQPAVPNASQSTTVSVVAQDPQGVNSCEVWWSANAGAYSHATMTAQGNGLYKGTIPGFSAGTIVQFYVRATDGSNVAATFPANGSNSGSLYMVNDGQANLAHGHNFRVILSPANWGLIRDPTNLMSEAFLPGTIIYDEQKPYYDVGIRLKGSESGRPNDPHPSFHIEFQPDNLFKGAEPDILLDTSGRPGLPNAQEEILVTHMANHAGNIPDIMMDMCRVIPPYTTNTSDATLQLRFEDTFIKTAYQEGDDGSVFLMEQVYIPQTTNSAGYKLPSPQTILGVDIKDLGPDKEQYRYNFILKNHRAEDNYGRFIPFAKTLWLPNGPILDAQSRQVMDMDEWLRTFALISLVGENDWYTFGHYHNITIYTRPSDNRMIAFPHDVEQLFLRPADSTLVGNIPSDFTDLENLYPANLRRLYAHALDIISTTFNTNYMAYWTAHYASFAPGQDYSDMLDYIPQRTAAVQAEIAAAGGNSPFSLGTNYIDTSNNLVTISGTAPIQVQALFINGIAYPVTWMSVSNWSITLPVNAGTNALAVTANDLNGNPLASFSTNVTVRYSGQPVNSVGTVVINEIQYNPLIDDASYVELHNTSTTVSFDLSNWKFNGLSYTFPSGSILTNGQYLLLVKDQSQFLNAYGLLLPPFDEFSGSLQTNGETLTLSMPSLQTGQPDIVVDRVKYSSSAPWPTTTPGTSLQLIDPAQDHFRPANWATGGTNGSGPPQWVYYSAVGTASSSTLYVYLSTAGDVYIDDLKLVAGGAPDVGPNLLADGDFEAGFPGPWTVSPNLSGSALSSQSKHTGSAGLHIVATSGGSSQSTAIWQDIPGGLALGQPYALSFWFLHNTNASGPTLTMRLSGSGIVASVNPGSGLDSAPAIATPGAPNSIQANMTPFQPLWLNEIQPNNVTGITNKAGQRTPWLELVNPSSNAVSLANLYLAANYGNLTRWAFPTNAVINPGQFKVIFADGHTNLSTTNELHTSFSLNTNAGSVALSRFDNDQPQVMDFLDYTNVGASRSYGAYPDAQVFDRQIFFYVTAGAPNNFSNAPLSIYINEWMADNAVTLADPGDGDFEDWFELYNPGTNAVDLAGYFLTDNLTNKFQFQIPGPGRYVVPAKGYLLVWADSETSQNATNRADLHVNFKLDKMGEAIGLFAADGTPIDAITFGLQETDISMGRFPDGGAAIVRMTSPTPRAANVVPNSPPTLAQISNMAITLGQTLLFTASATDTDQPPQTLSFSLGPGAPAGASIGSFSGDFSWMPTAAPATNNISVLVADSGVPSLNATQTFTVVVFLPPKLAGINLNGGQFKFTWQSGAGLRYQIEYEDALKSGSWAPLGAPILGTGGILSFTNSLPSVPQRFYRLRMVP